MKLDKDQSKKNIMVVVLLSSFLIASYVKEKNENKNVSRVASAVIFLSSYALTYLSSKETVNISFKKILSKKS